MSGWMATDRKDVFTVHVADDQETAEKFADNFAVRLLFGPIIVAVKILQSIGKTVINHSEARDENRN